MPPPRALTRSRLRGVMVSAWSKNQRSPRRALAVDRLEDVEEAGDRLVVGGVQAERPAVLRQQADHLGELLLHDRRQVGSRLEEVLEVGGGEDQHLAGAVHAVEVVALPRRGHLDPSGEVLQLPLGVLGEEVVGDAQGQLALSGQFLDDLVVVGVVLEAAAGVDGAGEPQPVQLAHELAGRVDLVLDRRASAPWPGWRRGSWRSAWR